MDTYLDTALLPNWRRIDRGDGKETEVKERKSNGRCDQVSATAFGAKVDANLCHRRHAYQVHVHAARSGIAVRGR